MSGPAAVPSNQQREHRRRQCHAQAEEPNGEPAPTGESKARLTLDWVRTSVWPRLGANRGTAPTKEEKEELLGYS